jgi:hypothetical protein
MKNKLFHESVVDPSFVASDDALNILREFRLEKGRYIEKMPDDWILRCQEIMMSNTDDLNRHKKLAYLSQIQSSVLGLRRMRSHHGKNWQEKVVEVDRQMPFDVIVHNGKVNFAGSMIDLDDYLHKSESYIGSIDQIFQNPSDWEIVLRPIVGSDNSLALVDRYFDLDRRDYYEAFISLLNLIRQYPYISELRIIAAPQSTSDDYNAECHNFRIKNLSSRIRKILNEEFSDLKIRIIVFSIKGIHKRYFTNKFFGLELDYGLRISRTQRQQISVLRASQFKDIKASYLTLVAGGVLSWPG